MTSIDALNAIAANPNLVARLSKWVGNGNAIAYRGGKFVKIGRAHFTGEECLVNSTGMSFEDVRKDWTVVELKSISHEFGPQFARR